MGSNNLFQERISINVFLEEFKRQTVFFDVSTGVELHNTTGGRTGYRLRVEGEHLAFRVWRGPEGRQYF